MRLAIFALNKNMSHLSQRLRQKNEATGMRTVAQYVQEFWECGWQPFEQRNDKGIDGLILMRKKGSDLGVRINVQIKCGLGYLTSIQQDEIRVSIDDKNGLKEHLDYWRNQIEPVVLILVVPHIVNLELKKEDWKEHRLNPQAWWVDVKDTNIQEKKTILKIPIGQKFGEHSKGDFLRLVMPILRKNENLPKIIPTEESRKLMLSDNIRKAGREFYSSWKNGVNDKRVFCKALDKDILISRTGWRHIVLSRRGIERRRCSLQLLGIAKQIIEEVEKDKFCLLGQKETPDFMEQKIGIKARIQSKNQGDDIVQVIILRRKMRSNDADRYWFYSVHYKR